MPESTKSSRFRTVSIQVLAAALCLFVLLEVNYPRLSPPTELALFSLLGLLLTVLLKPARRPTTSWPLPQWFPDLLLAAAIVVSCVYVAVQSEPFLVNLWIEGQSLGNRAGMETSLDTLIGLLGLLAILEATRRTIGWTLPILAAAFVFYAWLGPSLPAWLLPHRGYPLDRIASQAFLHSQGVFGIALNVMFTYVFLFVVFGSVLESAGGTQYVISLAQRIFRNSPGGPAKVAVLSSGLMGSLSGSAVANTATTGTFTIPMMRSCGFPAHVAGAIEAAASSGGALMPPVMGAAAYMMLELVDPPTTYLEIIRAALIPALLYYTSLLFLVHFLARRLGTTRSSEEPQGTPVLCFECLILVSALGGLIGFLILGYTPFRAVTLSILMVLPLSWLNRRVRIRFSTLAQIFVQSGAGAVPLICAAGCVGIIIGIVTLTGLGTKLPALILPLAQNHLPSALLVLMLSSIVLGMGLPSAVCYLLLATFIGPALSRLGVVPLAAHMFIFYFGMMSMVTPPVALAAYTASTIARSKILPTAYASFRFALVGFGLPFMFVYRPELLLLDTAGNQVGLTSALPALTVAVFGIAALASGISGQLVTRLSVVFRAVLILAALLLLMPYPDRLYQEIGIAFTDVAGILILGFAFLLNWKWSRREHQPSAGSS